jgi:hypothetical protein
LELYNLQIRKELCSIPLPGAGSHIAVTNNDSSLVATLDPWRAQKTLRIWKTSTLEEVSALPFETPVVALGFCRRFPTTLWFAADRTVTRWNLDLGKRVHFTLDARISAAAEIDDRRLAVACGSSLLIVESDSGKLLGKVISERGAIVEINISARAGKVLLVTRDGCATLWQLDP